ncbi:MAG: tRNA uridine-5-carboxymethylaminomethyl(34) synthesis enzyme MnmG, partial [Gammaproteobacteria bacterium]|nr:tRNA uridine-5-carboxymethylaminomethyl(34) synthesis enzyme MnmG [Gammaproteobacteria bacterium]
GLRLGVVTAPQTTPGATEPYRMFTSRAEYRLRLREDNADIRLTGVGHDLGLVGAHRWRAFQSKVAARDELIVRLKEKLIRPGSDAARRLEAESGSKLSAEVRLVDFLKRPEANIGHAVGVLGDIDADPEVLRGVETEVKYEGYVKRQDAEIAKIRRNENVALPDDVDYGSIPGLSMELRQKLEAVQPATLARAARIPGMTPAGLSVFMVHATRGNAGKKHAVSS